MGLPRIYGASGDGTVGSGDCVDQPPPSAWYSVADKWNKRVFRTSDNEETVESRGEVVKPGGFQHIVAEALEAPRQIAAFCGRTLPSSQNQRIRSKGPRGTTLRRTWARMIKTKSTLNQTVETVKKSSDTSSPT
jgi:hypothetical protein